MLRYAFAALAACFTIAPAKAALFTGTIESGGVGRFLLPSNLEVGRPTEYVLSFDKPTITFSGLAQTLVIYDAGGAGQGAFVLGLFTPLDASRFRIAPPNIQIGDATRPFFGPVIGVDSTNVVFFPTFADAGPVAFEVNIAPIPEPATWSMMIGGFGIAGVALRRRRFNARFA